MLVGLVMVITAVAYQQDTLPPQDTLAPPPVAVAPAPPPAPTIEQIRYMDGLKTVTRGIAQIRDGLNRVGRTQAADSLTRRRAARRLGGLCGSGRSFILNGRPKMQASAYADSLRILAKQLTTRLDSLTNVLPTCERSAARDPAIVATLTTRLKNYEDALLAFRNAQAAVNKPDTAQSQER